MCEEVCEMRWDFLIAGVFGFLLAVLLYYEWRRCRLLHEALTAMPPQARREAEASLGLGPVDKYCISAVSWLLAGLVVATLCLSAVLLCIQI